MALKIRGVLELLAWGAVTAAILQLHLLPGNAEDDLCGEWG